MVIRGKGNEKKRAYELLQGKEKRSLEKRGRQLKTKDCEEEGFVPQQKKTPGNCPKKKAPLIRREGDQEQKEAGTVGRRVRGGRGGQW